MSGSTTGPSAGPSSRTAAPALTPLELARWSWRQLTSMRTALILLFLLALAAVPGSVVPQDSVDSFRASQWREDHPRLTPIYEWLGLFSVYQSVWFTAIYVLLMISLVGCIVPRLRVYWDAVRAQPPRAPRNLARMPEHRTFETDESAEAVLDRAAALLRRRRFRVVPAGPQTDARADADAVSAQRGYLREAGNLLFHLSVLVVLVGFAFGSLWGFRGGVIVVTGDGFANTLSQYDDFRPGTFFDPEDLEPFDFTVEDFDVEFIREGREAGMAREFAADLDYRPDPASEDLQRTIAVNHPLGIGDTDVFLISHGYAPQITVRNADDSVAYSGPVVFLPEDASFRSYGVIKVPDAEQDGEPVQLGFEGEFYPTYAFTQATGPFSAFPEARNPAISMLVHRGDLGLDSGKPQSVYALDKSGLDPVLKPDGKPLRIDLAMGRAVTLPGGLGTVSFTGVSRFVKLQISETPGQGIALSGAVLALIGLLASLFIRPRRLWVRVRHQGGRRLVEVAGLDRRGDGDAAGALADELDELVAALRPRAEQETT